MLVLFFLIFPHLSFIAINELFTANCTQATYNVVTIVKNS